MKLFNLETFLRQGTVLDFTDFTDESTILNMLGTTYEIEDYGVNGRHLHYGNIRFSIFESRLNGITIYFGNYEVALASNIVTLNEDTPLLKMIDLLNRLAIKWTVIYEESKLDYFVVLLNNNIKIYYYYETEKLIKMTRVWL